MDGISARKGFDYQIMLPTFQDPSGVLISIELCQLSESIKLFHYVT